MSQIYQKDEFLDLLDELSDSLSFSDTEFENHGSQPLPSVPAYQRNIPQPSQSSPKVSSQMERQNTALKNKNEKILEEYTRLFRSYRKKEQEVKDGIQQIQKLKEQVSAKGAEDAKKFLAINDIVQKLKKINDQYKIENAQLKKIDEQTQKHVDQIRNERDSILKKNQHLKNENDRYTVLIKNLSEEAKETENHKQAFVEEVKVLQNRSTEQARRIEEQSKSLSKLSSEVQAKAAESRELHHKFLQLKDQNKALLTNFETEKAEKIEYQTQNNELQRLLGDCKVVIEKQKARIAGESKFISKIESLTSEVSKKHIELENQERRVATLENELKLSSANRAQEEKKFKAILAQKDLVIVESRNLYNEKQEKIQVLEEKQLEATRQLDFLNKENEVLLETVEENKIQIKEMTLSLQGAENENRQSTNTIAELKESIKNQNAVHKELQLKLSLLEKNLKDERSSNKDYSNKVFNLEASLNELSQELLSHKTIAQEQRTAIDQLTDISKLRAEEIVRLQEVEQDLTTQLEDLKLAHDELNKKHQLILKDKSAYEKRNESLEHKALQVKEVISKTNQSLSKMQEDLDSEKAKNFTLSKKLEELQAEVSKSNSENQRVMTDNHNLQTDIKKAVNSAQMAGAMTKEITAKMKMYLKQEKDFFAREAKIQDYKNWLDADKAFLGEQIQESIDIIRKSLEANPIIEYSKNINAEISKMDELLASPNVFGSIRAHYEELRTKLETQKQTGDKLLKIFEDDIEQRAQKLEKTLRNQVLWEVPPLPPNEIQVSSSVISNNQEPVNKGSETLSAVNGEALPEAEA